MGNQNFKFIYQKRMSACYQCHIFLNIAEPTEQQKTDYDNHIFVNKNLCRQLKKLDKIESKASLGKIVTATSDFPHGQISIL